MKHAGIPKRAHTAARASCVGGPETCLPSSSCQQAGHCFLQDGVRLRCALLKLLGKDIQGSRNAGQIAQDLSLHKILTHEWQVEPGSVE